MDTILLLMDLWPLWLFLGGLVLAWGNMKKDVSTGITLSRESRQDITDIKNDLTDLKVLTAAMDAKIKTLCAQGVFVPDERRPR